MSEIALGQLTKIIDVLLTDQTCTVVRCEKLRQFQYVSSNAMQTETQEVNGWAVWGHWRTMKSQILTKESV